MRDTELVGENIRYLLWRERIPRDQSREGFPRDEWPQYLAHRVGCEEDRARDLLRGRERPQPEEQAEIAEKFSVTEEELLFERLVDREDILAENLEYLLVGLEHGGQSDLAEAIGVDQITVSRWRHGRQTPTRTNQVAVCRYFGLPADVDLRKDPVFLSLDPVGERQRRAWLRKQVDELGSHDLQDLFFALKRLFGA